MLKLRNTSPSTPISHENIPQPGTPAHDSQTNTIVSSKCFGRRSTEYVWMVGHNGAIVMPEAVTLSTAPRAPRDKQEEAFELQQGTRVEIVDSISDKSSGKWLQVSTAGGHKAWLKAGDVEVI